MTDTEAVDHFFASLDGRVMTVAGCTWQIRLYSLRAIDQDRWLQLALVGDAMHTLTLRLSRDADDHDVLPLLHDWLSVSPADQDYFDEPRSGRNGQVCSVRDVGRNVHEDRRVH